MRVYLGQEELVVVALASASRTNMASDEAKLSSHTITNVQQ